MVANGDIGGFNSAPRDPTFAWAPDSRRLAFRADRETNNVIELYTVLADGTGLSKVSREVGVNVDVVAVGAEARLPR